MANTYSNDTQTSHIRRQLLRGRELCHDVAIQEVGAHRLAAIIHHLKSKENWPISTRYGDKGAAYYRLSKEGIQKMEEAHA